MCKHDPTYAAQATITLHHKTKRGRVTAQCDPCIEPIVQALNDGGIQTTASCCGHGHRPAAVILEDGRELLILPDYETARLLDHLWPDIHGKPTEGGAIQRANQAYLDAEFPLTGVNLEHLSRPLQDRFRAKVRAAICAYLGRASDA